uniref:Uncharacterized protein n=1 Tax=Borrelia garinii subsp. bavariensis (strain ATCC BAA-2496 / DSM 23469 / PBi) TaxID=290434 RepID=A0A7M4BKY3_BORGP|nr:hypothetical protein BGP249 [Borreliella bavariensis PBi]
MLSFVKFIFDFRDRVLCPRGDRIGGGAVLETQVLGGILVLAGYGVGDNNPTVGSTLVENREPCNYCTMNRYFYNL